MNVSVLGTRLQEHGLNAVEAAGKGGLLEVVSRAYQTLSSGCPGCAWWVPGRLEVFGKHTDYCGGHSLIATIPRGFLFLAVPRTDAVVRMLDAKRMERLEMNTARQLTHDEDDGALEAHDVPGWRRYARVVIDRLTRNFPGASIGADIVFASDLPSASGMSSSSALVVGLVSVLAEIGGLRDRAEWRDNMRQAEDLAGYYACFENGLSFGTLAGDAGVGTHGGSEDHVAIVCGAAGEVSAWRFVPIRHIDRVMLPDTWTFVVASSGVAAQKIGPAMDQYNSLSRRARRLLEVWIDSEGPQPSLFAALTSASTAPDRLRALVRQSGESTTELEARLDQFVREDRRVLEALEAFRAADRLVIGDLSEASQKDAELLLGNQVPETIALARSARDLGAFAASSFGAGFGGAVWALVDRGDADAFAARWLADYQRRFPHRTAATTFIAWPGPGLTRLF